MFDLSKSPAFQMASLTGAINILPNKYGLLNTMNLFPVKGVKTRSVYVEEKNGVLTILISQPVGAPGQANTRGKRKLRSFVVPHFPLDDIVLPADVSGVRAFGTEDQLQPIIQEVNDRLQGMKDKHDITLEYLRVGALKGIILDGDGSTLYNLYTEFGITAKEVDFVLGTTTTDVRAKCMEVKRHIEDHLLGEVMTGVRCLVSPEFFDKLVSHSAVKAVYQNWQAAQERLGGDMRGGFDFGGIIFQEYRAVASLSDGTAQKFIGANEGHAFPEGTMDTFTTAACPGDFNETVNTIGQLYYAKMKPRDMDRGYDLHTQSNPLPLCKRPAVLVKVKSSN